MPTVDLTDDMLFEVSPGEVVTWAEIKRRTALASGSGDHAELAKRLRASKRNRHGIYGRVLVNPDGPAAAASLEALLAENAALRAEAVGLREHRINADMLVSSLKADKAEAERKLAEAEDENTRWLFRMADIRESSGIGVKPMLGEVPGALRAMRERLDEAVLILTGIAKGEVPPEQHGHYLAHRQAVKAARTFLSKEAERG